MKKDGRTFSLRFQMMAIVALCWLLPVLLVLAIMGWYLADSVGRRAEKDLSAQLDLNLRMCAERVNSAVNASRLASYDPTIRDAWMTYGEERSYAALYREARSFLNRQYGSDSRFHFSVLWFTEDPEKMSASTLSGSKGAAFSQINQFWSEDFLSTAALAGTLDTSIGFLERDGRCYLVRNLMDTSFRPFGTLVLALSPAYYFDSLTALPWASSVQVSLNQVTLPIKGSEKADKPLFCQVDGDGYTLSAQVTIDYGVLLAPFSSYRYLLLGMAALLLPLLLLTFRFLQRKVTRPVAALMEGAAEIEAGKLGHQLSYQANSREFQYLTDSFNHMSGRLQHQFTRLYQEELALRDARMKALQSHINPHFLNNTLEIINWEARMSGDAKVSKMIEALATVLDAALARDKRPEIRLREEMAHVNAYLYIVSERYGKRLTVSIDIPEDLMDCMVPRLILQPVIENAVEHGFGPGGQGHVTLRGYRVGGCVLLDTENSGGLSPQDEEHINRLLSPDYDQSAETSSNIGIANVNQRLRLFYGPGSGLRIFRLNETQVVARLTIGGPEEESP